MESQPKEEGEENERKSEKEDSVNDMPLNNNTETNVE